MKNGAMKNLEALAEQIHQSFQTRTEVRDKALTQARYLTRNCAQAIRAVHRNEWETAQNFLDEASELAEGLRQNLQYYPEFYFAGYTQDALKEYTEANVVFALLHGNQLPTPESLGVEDATYLKGLAESAGELRRRCLDILRDGYSEDAEMLQSYMDDIYDVLVTMDYPDAVTMGLRRLTDIVRGINERTRGDLTVSLREQRLEDNLKALEIRLDDANIQN